MSFVFLSHAGEDKPNLTAVIMALMDAGLKVFVDDPTKLNVPEPVMSALLRIPAGERWEVVLDRQQRAASCILVCFSKNYATESARAGATRVIAIEEFGHARVAGKLVACRIDDVAPPDLPGEARTIHMPIVPPGDGGPSGHAALRLLIEDVKKKIEEIARANAESRGGSGGSDPGPFLQGPSSWEDPDIVYLVNRDKQDGVLGLTLDRVLDGERVQAGIIVGPENECVDEYRNRAHRHLNRERLGDSERWHELSVSWPANENPARFTQVYLSALATKMGLSRQAGVDQIVGALANFSRPVAVVSKLIADEWRADEADRLKAWLDLWRKLAAEPIPFQAIPLISLKLPTAKAGWHHKRPIPDARGIHVRNDTIWKHIMEAHNLGAAVLSSDPAPVLHPIHLGDADRWQEAHCSTQVNQNRSVDLVKSLYPNDTARKNGVPHRDFVDKAKALGFA